MKTSKDKTIKDLHEKIKGLEFENTCVHQANCELECDMSKLESENLELKFKLQMLLK